MALRGATIHTITGGVIENGTILFEAGGHYRSRGRRGDPGGNPRGRRDRQAHLSRPHRRLQHGGHCGDRRRRRVQRHQRARRLQSQRASGRGGQCREPSHRHVSLGGRAHDAYHPRWRLGLGDVFGDGARGVELGRDVHAVGRGAQRQLAESESPAVFAASVASAHSARIRPATRNRSSSSRTSSRRRGRTGTRRRPARRCAATRGTKR